MKRIITTSIYNSPFGDLELGSSCGSLCLCDWLTEPHHGKVVNRLKRILNADSIDGQTAVIEAAARQLDEYFAGMRTSFSVPLLSVGTGFQLKVWNELLKIPYGETISYGEMAGSMGIPGAVRALANANGANPMSIFVPCHRVIGSDGSLTGYGGGLDIKLQLLKLEGAI